MSILTAGVALGAHAQSISPGGIYAAANYNQTPNGGLEWVLGNINSFTTLSTLPVKLIRFEGEITPEGVARLEWETSEELTNAGFEVQKSRNGKEFEKIGFVQSSGTSHSRKSYEHIDPSPQPGKSYYRLKMIDLDGTFAFSRIIALDFSGQVSISTYPNPVTDKLFIETPDWSAVKSVEAVTKSGRIIPLRPAQGSGDGSTHAYDCTSLPAGVNIIKVTRQNGHQEQKPILKF